MASINFNALLSQLIDAAKINLVDKWPKVKDIATSSLQTIAQNVVDIEEMTAMGTITNEQSRLKLQIQENAFRTMLLTEEGLGLLAVEQALNAVRDIIKTTVNTAIGFPLL